MTADLEFRRQAIVEALRAVMAEPFPDRAAPPRPAMVTPEPAYRAATRTAEPPRAPAVETTTDPITTAEPDPVDTSESAAAEPFPASRNTIPPLREALAAHIDWDEVDQLEELDDDWEAPSIPPLETAGGMSRAASLALFGHA